jgi:hypothetical protein
MARHHQRVEVYRPWTELGVTKRAWVSRKGDVYNRDDITMAPSRGDEQAGPTPGTAALTFAGYDYNPRNAASPLFGLIGRNTPIRITSGNRRTLVDSFGRTVVDGLNTTRNTFNAGVEGWVGEGTTAVAQVAAPAKDGAGALQATKVMGPAFDAARFNDNSGLRDLSAGGTTIAVWALVPAGAAGVNWRARIEVQDPTFAWRSGPAYRLTPGTWTLLEFAPEHDLLTSCRSIGMQFEATGVNGAQAVYIDTVRQYTPETDVLWDLAGGTVPGDFDCNGNEAVVTHTTVNALRYATVDTGEADHRVRLVWDTSAADITGAGASVWVVGRFTDVSNYYAALVAIGTDEVMTLAIYKRVNGLLSLVAGPVPVAQTGPGGGGFDMITELYVEGPRLYASCWRRLVGDEPIEWMVSGEDDDLTSGNGAGWTSRRETGNTNVDLQVRAFDFLAVPGTIRFTGEALWKPRRGKTRKDRSVLVDAADPLRRIGQSDAPLRSALWRENLASAPIAYWPINDGANSAYAASALPGGPPMALSTADWILAGSLPLDWSPVSYGDWLEPIATPAAGLRLLAAGKVSMPTATAWSADFVFVLSTDVDPANAGAAFQATGTGTAQDGDPRIDWLISYGNNSYTLIYAARLFSGGSAVTVATGPLAVATGRIIHSRLITSKDGADIDWELRVNNAVLGSGTLAASTWQPMAQAVTVCGVAESGSAAIGHLAVWDHANPPFNAAAAAVVGRAGERAGDRLARLLREHRIAFTLIGNAADTPPMGPQRIDTLPANLNACEDVDMGLLHGTRHQLGVSYRTRVSLQAQNPLVLNVAAGEVADPLEPDIGDQGVVNDVTVTRPGGSSARSVAEDGPLNVNPPNEDTQGVGLYPWARDIHADTDSQLQGLADWRRYRGTQDVTRYPQVTIDLDALAAQGKTDLVAKVARMRVGDRLDIDHLEPEGVIQLVPGYTETISVERRTITANAVPAVVYDVGVFNDPGTRYDSGYSTLAAPFAAGTDASLQVAVEAGRRLWVSPERPPTEVTFPFDLDVDGAQIGVRTVGAVLSSNPWFETDVALWNANAGAAIAHSTAQAHEGTGSLLITPDGVTVTTGATQAQAGNAVTVPGATYLLSGWLRATNAIADARMAVDWYEANGTTFISSGLPAPVALAPGVWTRYAAVVTAPALAERARLRARFAGTPTGAIHVDEALLIPTASYTASPQTLTVDTAVRNAIAKLVPTAAPVRLWRPKRYGL